MKRITVFPLKKLEGEVGAQSTYNQTCGQVGGESNCILKSFLTDSCQTSTKKQWISKDAQESKGKMEANIAQLCYQRQVNLSEAVSLESVVP